MNDINNVILVGRLTRDCEFKMTQSGTAIANFSIACNKSKKTDSGYKDEADFFDVTIIGKLAESISKYLTEGKQIIVNGELRQERWTHEGKNMSKVNILANSIQIISAGEKQSKQEEPEMSDKFIDDKFSDDEETIPF